MSGPDAASLPRLGEVFFDARGSTRSMRLSWYPGTGVAVFSIWQGGTCTGTFRLPAGDLPRLMESLQRGGAVQDGGARAVQADQPRLAITAGPEPQPAMGQAPMGRAALPYTGMMAALPDDGVTAVYPSPAVAMPMPADERAARDPGQPPGYLEPRGYPGGAVPYGGDVATETFGGARPYIASPGFTGSPDYASPQAYAGSPGYGGQDAAYYPGYQDGHGAGQPAGADGYAGASSGYPGAEGGYPGGPPAGQNARAGAGGFPGADDYPGTGGYPVSETRGYPDTGYPDTGAGARPAGPGSAPTFTPNGGTPTGGGGTPTGGGWDPRRGGRAGRPRFTPNAPAREQRENRSGFRGQRYGRPR